MTALAPFTTLLLWDSSDLDDLQGWSENHHSDSTMIIISGMDKNFTYWSEVGWEVQWEEIEAQGGQIDTDLFHHKQCIL